MNPYLMSNHLAFKKRHLPMTLPAILLMIPAKSHADGFEPVVIREQPVVTEPAFSSTEGFSMTVHAPPGTYGIQASGNLSSWTPLDDIAIGEFSVQFNDPASTDLGSRFYSVVGDFESSDYHLLEFFIDVESDIGSRMHVGYRDQKTLRISSNNSTSVRARFFDEWASDITISSDGNHRVNGFIESGSGDHLGELILQTDEDRIDVSIPGSIEENPFFRIENRQQLDFSLHSINDNLTTLVGSGLGEYTITEGESVTDGREAMLAIIGRKSTNASIGALEGGWGVIRYLVEANEHGAIYNVGAYVCGMNPQDNTLDVEYVREVEIEQFLNGAPVEIDLQFVDDSEIIDLPIDISTDGRINIADEFNGFVSSSGDFIAASGVGPDIFNLIDPNESIELPEEEVMSQFLIAVPLETNPQLAGRGYRVTGIGNWVTNSGFELVTHPDDANTLVFSADGTTADLTYKANGYSVPFQGGGINEAIDPPQTFTLDVTIDSSGLVRMGFSDDGVEAAVFGFARKGGDVLILGGGYEVGEDAGIDTLIAIEIQD